MTAPSTSAPGTTSYTPPMRVKIPTDQPRWPDAEKVMVTILDDFLAELEPAGYACIVPPANHDELINKGHAIVQVMRSGGNADRTVDHTNIFVQVTTAYRSDSWDVLGWLRPKLRNFSGVVTNPDDSQAIVMSIDDMRGPQRAPSPSPGTNTVSAGFVVETRLDR